MIDEAKHTMEIVTEQCNIYLHTQNAPLRKSGNSGGIVVKLLACRATGRVFDSLSREF